MRNTETDKKDKNTMKRNKYIYAILFMILFCVTACGKREVEYQEMADISSDEDTEIDENTEMYEEITDYINEPEIELKENEDMAEEEQEGGEDIVETEIKNTKALILTKDNFNETMKTIFYTCNKRGKYDWDSLPLTEGFASQCKESFPRIKGIDDVNNFNICFWGIREDGKCVCLCEYDRSKSYQLDREKRCDYYYIEMDLEDDRIASIEMTLVQEHEYE